MKTTIASLMGGVCRSRYTETCKSLRYRSIICDPEFPRQLRNERICANAGNILTSIGRGADIGFLTTMRYTRRRAVNVYTEIPNDIESIRLQTGSRGEQTYVLLRVKGSFRNASNYIESRMYLPHATVPNAGINLNIIALVEGIMVLRDENGNGKGVALIIVDSVGELPFLEMLGDLFGDSNRLHGVGSGRTKCHSTGCPAKNGESKDQAATRYIAGLCIPRILVNPENRQSRVRGG